MSARRDPATAWRARDTSGFTLIETLVAFTVLATLLSVLFRGVVTMRAGAMAFDDHTHRDLVAGAVLEEALANRALRHGRYSGTQDGHRWTMVATPIDLAAQMPPPDKAKPGAKDTKPAWVPQRLVVTIETKGRPLEVETIRLVKAE